MWTVKVDDKYQYSCDNKDSCLHGWISTDPAVGFWLITPSNEFRSGGPVKQNLTSHVGPTTLAVFISAHYAGEDLVPKIGAGEEWKKVFGPVFIYLNSTYDSTDALQLWEDAKAQNKFFPMKRRRSKSKVGPTASLLRMIFQSQTNGVISVVDYLSKIATLVKT